jgi:hypothetical protein
MPGRVLLITPEFHGIEIKLKVLLEGSGYTVHWINNKNLSLDFKGKESKFKFLRKIYFFLFFPKKRNVKRELANLDNLRFDILFSINCNIVCPYLFKRLKKNNPELFSILFLWDSFSMYSWEKEIELFDKVFTFDRSDSEKHAIEYLPNFYSVAANRNNLESTFDLSFVGKFSPERLSLLDQLIKQISDREIRFFFFLWPGYKKFLHNHLVYTFLKKLGIRTLWIKNYILHFEANELLLPGDFIRQQEISFEESQRILLSSNVILDLSYSGQTGYSHSLIAALANGKKVITTNQNITRETYFNPDQIWILDTENPIVNVKWIREKCEFIIDPFIADLELSEWLNHIINARVV